MLLISLLLLLLGQSEATLVIPIPVGTHWHASCQASWNVRLLLSRLLVDLVIEVGLTRPRLYLLVTDPVYAVDLASMLLDEMILSSLARYGTLPLGHAIHILHGLAPLYMPTWQLSRHGYFLQSLRILSFDGV